MEVVIFWFRCMVSVTVMGPGESEVSLLTLSPTSQSGVGEAYT